jgi:ADP-dependent NAD(P)H-hydrate dehydratase / NAD(P)H-hydrate epimerase
MTTQNRNLYRIATIKQMEADHQAAHPKNSLMQRAGEAVAELASSLLKQKKAKTVLVLAGPGNNGGDAWVAAETLRKAKKSVTVLALGEQTWTEPAAKSAFAAFSANNGVVVKAWPKAAEFAVVIDGLFGTGLSKAPSGAFADVIRMCNSESAAGACTVIAIDVPSGLNADTGVAYEPTIVADQTLTFVGAKPGLFTNDGKDVAGLVTIETLGTEQQPTLASLLTREAAASLIPGRRANSHKGTYGNVGVVGGSEGMTGAAVLAARAALHIGPGKVYLGLFDKDRPSFDLLNPEIMVRDAKVLVKDDSMTAFAIGMGMGETGAASLLALLSLDKPTVVDADALNVISTNPSIRGAFEAKKAENSRGCLPFVFTPHPGEAARLLSVSSAEVQADRPNAALELAAQFASVVVLKGAGSIIAHPDGRYVINTTGNSGMASGGMGDALSGMIAALMAMGLDTWDAARLGVYLHGAAGDSALHHGMGPHGLTASEVIFEARTLLNSQLEDHHHDDTEEE